MTQAWQLKRKSKITYFVMNLNGLHTDGSYDTIRVIKIYLSLPALPWAMVQQHSLPGGLISTFSTPARLAQHLFELWK